MSPDEESDQVVEIMMETIIPAAFGEAMMDWTVMNYMTLTNDDKSME